MGVCLQLQSGLYYTSNSYLFKYCLPGRTKYIMWFIYLTGVLLLGWVLGWVLNYLSDVLPQSLWVNNILWLSFLSILMNSQNVMTQETISTSICFVHKHKYHVES